MLSLQQVTVRHGKNTVLSDLSFSIEPGEFVCIVGDGGSGKTSLLSLFIGAENPSAGTVEVDGVDLRVIPPPAMQLYRRRVGMVFQDRKLLPHRTVAENVAFPLEAGEMNDRTIRKRVPAVLTYLGLEGKARAFPQELSAGEQARVALARAIIHKPAILLADEPLADLDPVQAKLVLKVLRDLHTLGSTVVLATHDAALAAALKARTITLKDGRAFDSARRQDPPAQASAPAEPTTEEEVTKAQRKAVSRIHPEPGRRVKITSIGAL
ncbi:MAG: ATP-binding cassette domain-containing protein [Candidatus Peribacteraceae bacterium]|jgi:cell division transport system ATP-binding protein